MTDLELTLRNDQILSNLFNYCNKATFSRKSSKGAMFSVFKHKAFENQIFETIALFTCKFLREYLRFFFCIFAKDKRMIKKSEMPDQTVLVKGTGANSGSFFRGVAFRIFFG